MARAKRIEIEMQSTEEIKTTVTPEPVEEKVIPVADIRLPSENIEGMTLAEVKTARETSVNPVEPPNKPICDMEQLSDDEKKLIIRSRIQKIVKRTSIPYIPALVTYKESDSPSAPPVVALIDTIDHTCVQEAWDFYKSNAKSPTSVEFLAMLRDASRNPERVYQRVVPISLL